jgi:hypothetical protein
VHDQGGARQSLVDAALGLLVVLVGAAAFVVRFEQPERRASGDTYYYVSQAEEFAGVPTSTATDAAKRLMCRDYRNLLNITGGSDPSCSEYPVITTPRYTAIFASRPLWPLLLSAPVSLLGVVRGVIVVSLLGAMLAALAVYLVLRALGSSPEASGAAGVVFTLLPTGYWSDKLLPEGAVLATLVVAVYAGARLVQGRGHLVPLVACLVALYAFKPANGMALAVALLAAAAVLLALRRGRRQALALGAVGIAGIAGWLAVSKLLGLPSFEETLQDLATVHFSRPDTPRPYGVLWDLNRSLWLRHIPGFLGVPWPYPIVLPCAAVVLYALRRAGLVVAAVALAGTLIVLAHPLLTQYDRLVSSVWLVVVATVAVVLDGLPGLLASVFAPLTDSGAAQGRVRRWSGRSPFGRRAKW